jgi:hypothetical protein
MENRKRTNVIPLDREKKREHREERRSDFNLEEAFKDLGIRSFKQEYRRLSKMSGEADFSGQQASYALLRSQFSMLVNMLPILEETVHKYKNDRAAYAAVAVSNHLREVAHDLRSYDDKSTMINRIRMEVVNQALTLIATKVVASMVEARRKIGAKSSSKDARFAAEVIRKMQEETAQIFSRAEQEAVGNIEKVLKS